MKRLLLLLITITAFSCSSDDSEPVLQPNQVIVGTWLEVAGKVNPQDEWVNRDCSEFQTSQKYIFNSDGTYTMLNGCDESLWPPVNGTYVVEGNVLSVTGDEGTGTSYIGVVSSTQMTKQDFSSEFTGTISLFQKQ